MELQKSERSIKWQTFVDPSCSEGEEGGWVVGQGALRGLGGGLEGLGSGLDGWETSL